MFFHCFCRMLGWEYGITIPPDDKPRSWVAAEKMYHIHRRKRLVRPRKKITDAPSLEVRAFHYSYCLNSFFFAPVLQFRVTSECLSLFVLCTITDLGTISQQKKDLGDGWEYSSLIGWKFHRKERSSDTFRRRRWRRKMAPANIVGPSAIFNLEGALVRPFIFFNDCQT